MNKWRGVVFYGLAMSFNGHRKDMDSVLRGAWNFAWAGLSTVIGAVFFPESSEFVQLMATFGIVAVSFILRLIGAMLWGTWDDRRGRRWALSRSILIMAASTVAISLLPGHAAMGMEAPLPLLLLRMPQGLSASGEYAGARTSSPSTRRDPGGGCTRASSRRRRRSVSSRAPPASPSSSLCCPPMR